MEEVNQYNIINNTISLLKNELEVTCFKVFRFIWNFP